MTSFYAFAADVLVGIHALYVLFVVAGQAAVLAGGLLRWKWIRNMKFRVIHLIAIGIVAAQSAAGVLCPLTIWEYRFRELAGQYAEWDISFTGRLLRMFIYYDLPEWVFMVLHIGFALLVLLTMILFPPRRKATRTSA